MLLEVKNLLSKSPHKQNQNNQLSREICNMYN